jgi:hypothetical protein
MSFFPKQPSRGFQDLLAVVLFLLITLVFFARFLTGDQVMAFKDLSRYFYPLRHLMAEQVLSGHLPLWNPYLFCGFPLMATLQIGFFYPLTIIYYLLPFSLAFNYYIILHYFLAACFMYALLRHFKLETIPAFFGGLILAFSGYLLSVSNMNTSLSSVIWLPLALLFLDKLINSAFSIRHSAFIWLTLALALMFLGGEPTIIYTTGWFLFFYTLVFADKKLKGLAALGFSFLLAGGLVAVQLLPFIELSRLSDRIARTGFDLISYRSFPPRELLTFIFPYFFGNPAQLGSYNETLLGTANQDWLISPYLGILPLVFVLFNKRDKLARFLWAGALAALIMALGRYTPVYQLFFYFVPGVSLIRFPVKYLFMMTFCLSFLSALGFAKLIDLFEGSLEEYRKVLPSVVAVVAALLALSLAGYFFLEQITGLFSRQYSANIPTVFFSLLATIIKFNLESLYNLTAYLVALTVLLFLYYWGRISQKVFACSLVLLAGADLLVNGYTIPVGVPAEVFTLPPPGYSLVQKGKELSRFFYTPEAADANRLTFGDSYGEALFNTKDNFTANWPILDHLYDFYGYESIVPYKLSRFYGLGLRGQDFKRNFKALRLSNVKYVIAAEPLYFPELKLLKHKSRYGQNFYFYEDLAALPRAYFVNARGEPALALGRVAIDSYRPGYIALKVQAGNSARLFLSESYYPGWQATIDGSQVKIMEADQLFSAVDVPAGEHEVRFVYSPLSLKIGAGISAFTILVLLGLAWQGRRKNS